MQRIKSVIAHTHFSPLSNFDSWSDLAGALALVAAVCVGYLEGGLDSTKFWGSMVLSVLFFSLTWLIEVDDIPWMKNLQLALLTAIPIITIVFSINGWSTVLMFFVLSASAMYLGTPKYGYYWICGFGLIMILTYVTVWSEIGSVWVALGTFAGFLFIGSATESQIKALDAKEEIGHLFTKLEDAHEQLKLKSVQAEELAATNERNRLAREVHDTLGHQLTVAAVQLEGAQKLIRRDPEKAEEMVSTVRGQVLEGLNELRKTVAALRAPIEEDLSLPNAISRLVDNFERATNIATELAIADELPDLPSNHHQALYRTTQEALTNIQKHAEATQAWVSLIQHNRTAADAQIILSILDNGVGVKTDGRTGETSRQGFGIEGIRERAALVGGQATIEARATGGTAVTFSIPTVISVRPEEQRQ